MNKEAEDALYQIFADLDDAWQAAIDKQYGKQKARELGLRYDAEGKGQPGDAINAAYVARMKAQENYHQYWETKRSIEQ